MKIKRQPRAMGLDLNQIIGGASSGLSNAPNQLLADVGGGLIQTPGVQAAAKQAAQQQAATALITWFQNNQTIALVGLGAVILVPFVAGMIGKSS